MNLFQQFFNLLKSGGLPFLFLLVLLESNPIIGSFIPGQVLVIFIGFLISTKQIYDLHLTILIVFIGAFLGDCFSYYLGRKYGHSGLKIFGLDRENKMYLASYSFFKKYGKLSLILGREFNLTRAFMPFFAGCFKMRLLTFLIFSFVSCIIWSVLSIYLGYYFGFIIIDNFNFIMEFILALIIYIIFIIIVYKGLKSFYIENLSLFRQYSIHNIFFMGIFISVFILMCYIAKWNYIQLFNDYFSFLHISGLYLTFNFFTTNFFLVSLFLIIGFGLLYNGQIRICIVYLWSLLFGFFMTLIFASFLKISYNFYPYFNLIILMILLFYIWILFKLYFNKMKYFYFFNIFWSIFILFILLSVFSLTNNFYMVCLSFIIGVIESEIFLILSHYQVLDKSLSKARFDDL